MRILFINTQDIKGGAAIAVDRLRSVLKKNFQAETSLIVGTKLSGREDVKVTRRGSQIILEKVIHKLTNTIGMQYQYFPYSSKAIIEYVKEYKPDIISLHNTHGGYFETELVKTISQIAPIVWTLHDMWSFTGNSAHTFGDESWKEMNNSSHLTGYYPAIGLNLGPWLLKRKKQIYRKANLSVVTPSRWLHSLASQSPVFEGKKIQHINNGIDLNTFSPERRKQSRMQLNFDDAAPVIMFSAENLAEGIWKGGSELMDVLRIINDRAKQPLHLLMIGEGVPGDLSRFENLRVHLTGYVSNEVSMADYLSSADVFLYPTKADNLPNVLVEAIGCGTPCVTFDVGGCSEIVVNDVNGYVVPPGNFKAMAQTVLTLLEGPTRHTLSENARRIAVDNFSSVQMGEQYYEHFLSRINEA
jgi:glycosyltransferase involved in cell wall biosynthesis